MEGFCRPLRISWKVAHSFPPALMCIKSRGARGKRGERPDSLERAGIGITLRAASFRRQEEID